MNKKVLIGAVPYPVVTPGSSAELVRRLVEPTAGAVGAVAGVEREMGVDQTNASIVVDEAVVVKWLTPPVPEPHPGVLLLEHLAEVGFAETPALLGVARSSGHIKAVLTKYIPHSKDGWEWYTDDVLAWLDGSAPLQPLIDAAARLGGLAARLHGALATPSTVIPVPVTTVAVGPIHESAVNLLEEAIAVTDGVDGVPLRLIADRVRAEIDSLADCGDTAGQAIHGDLHVGQILRAGDRLWVTDFDGDPLADTLSRRQPQPPARDLAGLLQSIDHVGRVVHRRRPDVSAATIEGFITPAIAAAHDAYRAGTGRGATDDDPLLRPLRVIQELHELVYAARHLPHWRYVPDAALPALLAHLTRTGTRT